MTSSRRSREGATARLAAPALLAAILALVAARPLGAQDTPVPTLEPPPSEVAPTLEPATAPATAQPPTETPAPRGDDRDEEQAPPPGTAAPQATPTPEATRTRRATRTPRTTTTPTPLPFTAGGLSLTLEARPDVLVVGEGAELRLTLLNRTDRAARDATLMVVLPAEVLVDRLAPSLGQTARAGPIVRWYLPELPPGETAVLALIGALGRARPEGVGLCVTLLSAGSQPEVCVRLRTAAALSAPAPTAGPTPAGAGADAEQPGVSRTVLGGALLLFGLLASGLLLGERLCRGGARSPRG